MDIKYHLQQYEDGTFGYYLIDGDEHCNYKTESKVICMQGEDEDRNEFIAKNGIIFRQNQYGSNLKLDTQINYGDYHVRVEVARQGYGLEKLINDKDYDVSIAVAEQCYGLDKLVNDESFWVREAVAEQGYGLDKLVNDVDYRVRAEVADQGNGLDKLVNDKDGYVRAAVAKQGYGLDKLINDESSSVRAAVAEQSYGLDKLINDKSPLVRQAVAEQGYGLNKLINDEDLLVRASIAWKGYGLNKLINDKDHEVRKAVASYLNNKADDNFIIDLGNILLDMGYKLSTNNVKNIFTDETYTKFKEFHTYGVNGLIYQILARLLWKNIRVKEIYDSKFSEIMKIYLRQHGLLNDDQICIRL